MYNEAMDMYVTNTSALAHREEEALSLLSPDRREKALRLRGEARLRSLAGGLLLRRFVGPGPYAFKERGKPYLPGGPCFSLSHSGELAVLSVSDAPVGADIERIAPLRREAVLSRVLTPAERLWMGTDEGRFAFLWTRKEAAVKWAGCGIGPAVQILCVLPGETPRIDGALCALSTAEYQGYMISAASAEDASFALREIPGEELFREVQNETGKLGNPR